MVKYKQMKVAFFIVSVLSLLGCQNGSNEYESVKEYYVAMTSEHIYDELPGVVYGLSRNNSQYALKVHDSIWFHYSINDHGIVTFFELSPISKDQQIELLAYKEFTQDLIDFANKYRIKIIESSLNCLKFVFDLSIVNESKDYIGVIIVMPKKDHREDCYNIQDIKNKESLVPGVYYYKNRKPN